MRKLIFKLDILSNLVLSKNAATEGEHQTLDYIPGSVFLGIAAGTLYDAASELGRKVFHGDKVQFNDAKPLIGGEESYKVPLSLFKYKGQDLTQDAWHIYNTELDKEKQPVQMREGYINAFGQKSQSMSFNLRTAIKDGMAAEGQLYGYQSMPAGSAWSFSVYLDSEAPVNEEQLIKALEGRRNIGRSRSAEYGLVSIQYLESKNLIESEVELGRVVLYAESDLCFLNEFGYPKLKPDAEELGLPKGSKVDWSLSQIRYRSLSKYNYKRKAHDASLYVIEKGSVLIAEAPDNFSNKAEYTGIGYHRHAGYGRIRYNPLWFNKLNFRSNSSEGIAPNPSWLNNIPITKDLFSLDILLKQENEKNVSVQKIQDLWNMIPFRDKAAEVDSASQWSKLEGQLIKWKRDLDADSVQEFMELLFDESKGFFFHGEGSKIWKKSGFHLILKKELDKRKLDSIEIVIFFANKMRHHVK